MSAAAPTYMLAYLHPGDLTLSRLLPILLAWAAALAFRILLIGLFVRVVARPEEKVLSIRNRDADKGRG